MNQGVGQILRLTGLGLEMWGIYSLSGAERAIPVESSIVRYLPTIAIVLGFVLWISGTVIMHISRRHRLRAIPTDSDA